MHAGFYGCKKAGGAQVFVWHTRKNRAVSQALFPVWPAVLNRQGVVADNTYCFGLS